jgi:transcriptional regulator with XRE-family HTH domain
MSTEKKMFPSLPPSCLPEQRRAVWGRLFGSYIGTIRKNAGLPIEKAARLSGMEISEWAAVEEGTVPRDINRLRAMTDAMAISFDTIANLVLLCRDAWEL